MIDPAVLRRLEQLNILARSAATGGSVGRRPVRRPGTSQEFHDYRHYAAGDELRYLDWNVYARHGSLFVKEFSAEENVHVAVAVDTSASMSIGEPKKIDAARNLALGLAYVGLCGFDSVSLFSYGERLEALRTFLSGKGRVHEAVTAVDSLRAEGAGDIAAAFGPPIPRVKGTTVCLILGDLLDLIGLRAAVRSLLSQKVRVHLIHILAPEDVAPSARGRTRLRDAETGRERELYLSADAVRRYKERFGRYLEELEGLAREREIRYVRVLASDPLESMVVAAARAGILERTS